MPPCSPATRSYSVPPPTCSPISMAIPPAYVAASSASTPAPLCWSLTNVDIWLTTPMPPDGYGRCHPTTAHDFGDCAAPLPLRGRQNLAPRRPHGSELQRSLRGEGSVPAADGSVAEDCAARIRLRAGNVASAALKTPVDPSRAVHRN